MKHKSRYRTEGEEEVNDLDQRVLRVLLTEKRRRYWSPGAVWYCLHPNKLNPPKIDRDEIERSIRDLSLLFPFVRASERGYFVDMKLLFDMWIGAITPPAPPNPDEDYIAMLEAAGMI